MIDLLSLVRRVSGWLAAANVEPAAQPDLKLAGERAAARALDLWRRDIIDPPIGSKHPRAAESLAVINAIIKRNRWTWLLPYRGNGPPQWCVMFDGECWAEARLDESWLMDYFASTDRVLDWSTYKRFSPKSKANPPPAPGRPHRLCGKLERGKPPPFTPLPGDIMLVGNGKRYAGDHGTIVMGYDDDIRTFDTISGNGGGVGPNGDKRDFRGGISRRDYSIDVEVGYRAMWLIRPATSDLG